MAGRSSHASRNCFGRYKDGQMAQGQQLPGLRCHGDSGSQFKPIRYGERLTEIGAVPSIGSVGDSYDKAFVETVNGYYKAELVRGQPKRLGETIEQLKLTTLTWVHWNNTERLQCPRQSAKQHPMLRSASQED